MLIGAALFALYALFFPHPNAVTAPYLQAEKLIEKAVHDEARKKTALEIVQQAEGAAVRQEDELKKSVNVRLTPLLDTRTSSSSEIEAALAPLDASAVSEMQKQVDFRLQLRNVLTESEWSQVFPAPVPEAATDRNSESSGK